MAGALGAGAGTAAIDARTAPRPEERFRHAPRPAAYWLLSFLSTEYLVPEMSAEAISPDSVI